ncbi:type II CAAX prenyl endopeptidase Rce1 family protein [Planobispora siamensis]|uniref:Abortive infection protein n=1 Tax=Planobispora siamensis TaxID=936338 RepID=A0A8J3S8W3_9ACTN|nr:CPBP family intramembrane glutamic endopeptidase [Planobispora siamensis]GIH89543.1 abortive infection protein [Planobispora siamensis]
MSRLAAAVRALPRGAARLAAAVRTSPGGAALLAAVTRTSPAATAASGTPASGTSAKTLAGVVGVMVAANVLNNRIAPRLAPATSAAATGAMLAMARGSGLSWPELGFRDGARGLKVGGALAAAVAGVYGAGIAIPATRRFFRDERALALSWPRVLEEALVQVPFGTVLLEEVGFRGVLYGLLARSHGTLTATGVSSALFGLWHILPAIDMSRANPALAHVMEIEEWPEELGERPEELGERPAGERAMEPAEVARVVAGSVVFTALAGILFCELRRHNGLVAPSMLHIATNSLGYLFAKIAPKDP